MDVFGFSSDDFESEIGIWPDNWAAFEVFAAMQTQWRAGMAGPVGLDYPALESVMRLCGIRKCERAEVFELVRLMELEALSFMRRK